MQFDLIPFMIALVNCWQYSASLSKMLQEVLPANLTNFQTAFNSQSSQFVIYSGKSGGQYSNKTFLVSLKNGTVDTLTQQNADIRIQACILAVNNSMYLFGGYRMGEDSQSSTSGQFWRLDLTTHKWSLLHQNLQPYRFCQMIQINNTILIFGASFDSVLDVFTYSPSTQHFSNLTVQFYGFCTYNLTQWDGTTVTITLPIEQCPKQQTNLSTTSLFPTDTLNSIELTVARTNSQYMMQTQNHIYTYEYSGDKVTMRLYDKMQISPGRIFTKSVTSDNWTIFCNLNANTNMLSMNFLSHDLAASFKLTPDTPHFYSNTWPSFNNITKKFSLLILELSTPSQPVDFCLLLLTHGDLEAYVIHEDIYFASSRPIGVLSSVFGINQCKEGWTGRNCTVPACPNSFSVNAVDQLGVIRFECSGHGTCQPEGCVCDGGWGGTDCNIYLRTACYGQLVSNYPMKNCECRNSTIGGNDCSVIFCPGDCFGHGQCKKGICQCHKNYYGADCSAMIFGFPE